MQQTSAFAPGRVELLGNHTDYNEGLVLSAALNLGVAVTGSRLSSDRITLRSCQIAPPWEGSFEEARVRRNSWSDYPRGVIWALQGAGYPIEGFEAEFDATLPAGAGLSSSAAIEVATADFLSRLFDLALPPMELAKLCRKAENEFVGVQCGLLDQISSLFGKKNHAIFLDCRSERVETIPFPQGTVLLVLQSGVPHVLTGGEYNERRLACFEAARLLGVRALRDVTSEQVLQISDPLVRRRALHITGENERVSEAVAFLKKGNVRGFGALMTASHRSSQENFENSTPELDVLVELALEQEEVYGARLTGGGFGGSVIVLLPQEHSDQVANTIVTSYAKRTGHTAKPILCKFADGAISLAQ